MRQLFKYVLNPEISDAHQRITWPNCAESDAAVESLEIRIDEIFFFKEPILT